MDERTGFKTRNIVCVPLTSETDGIIGVVQLINKTTDCVLGRGRRCTEHDFMGSRSSCSSYDFTADEITSTGGPVVDTAADSSAFGAHDLQFLQVFASQAATAIAASGVLTTACSSEMPLVGVDASGVEGLQEESVTMAPVCAKAPAPDLDEDAKCDQATETLSVRRSRRACQRAAKYWKSVRCRTPSPDAWDRFRF